MTKVGLLFLALFFVFVAFYYFRTNSLKLAAAGSSLTTKVLGESDLLGQPISNVSEDSEKISYKVGNIKVIFSKKKDLGLQIQALQELVKQLRMDGRNIQIDLRFDKAVITNY